MLWVIALLGLSIAGSYHCGCPYAPRWDEQGLARRGTVDFCGSAPYCPRYQPGAHDGFYFRGRGDRYRPWYDGRRYPHYRPRVGPGWDRRHYY